LDIFEFNKITNKLGVVSLNANQIKMIDEYRKKKKRVLFGIYAITGFMFLTSESDIKVLYLLIFLWMAAISYLIILHFGGKKRLYKKLIDIL